MAIFHCQQKIGRLECYKNDAAIRKPTTTAERLDCAVGPDAVSKNNKRVLQIPSTIRRGQTDGPCEHLNESALRFAIAGWRR
jgi:hypothetical protein